MTTRLEPGRDDVFFGAAIELFELVEARFGRLRTIEGLDRNWWRPFRGQVLAKLTAAGLVTPETLRGCSDDEIASLERAHGVQLPAAYREFLRVMGKQAGTFFQGTDFLYDDLDGMREASDELLEDDEADALDPADFVFAMHQGYTFLFFRCGVSDDPPVSLYVEQEGVRQVADSFTSWLLGAARDEIGLAAELRER